MNSKRLVYVAALSLLIATFALTVGMSGSVNAEKASSTASGELNDDGLEDSQDPNKSDNSSERENDDYHVPKDWSVGNANLGRSSSMSQWGIETIDAVKAARIADGGSDVNVAIVDTGVDYDHPALSDSVVWGVNVIGSTEYGLDAADDNMGHGTHVAGTVAAESESLTGVAPEVDIYAL